MNYLLAIIWTAYFCMFMQFWHNIDFNQESLLITIPVFILCFIAPLMVAAQLCN